jgi:hypothetical protein
MSMVAVVASVGIDEVHLCAVSGGDDQVRSAVAIVEGGHLRFPPGPHFPQARTVRQCAAPRASGETE